MVGLFYERCFSAILPPPNGFLCHTHRGRYYTLGTSGLSSLAANPRFHQIGTRASPCLGGDNDLIPFSRLTLVARLMTCNWNPTHLQKTRVGLHFPRDGAVKSSLCLGLSMYSLWRLPTYKLRDHGVSAALRRNVFNTACRCTLHVIYWYGDRLPLPPGPSRNTWDLGFIPLLINTLWLRRKPRREQCNGV